MRYEAEYMKTGQKVRVYWNLHKKCFSVMSLEKEKKGLVVAHVNELNLDNPVFKVSEKGRQRVLKEKKKNVHAFVEGTITKKVSPIAEQIKYNPYRLPFFHTEDGTKVETRNIAILQTRENKTPSIQGW